MAHENEYFDNMVTMLELIWGDGYMAPGGPGNVAKLLQDSIRQRSKSSGIKVHKAITSVLERIGTLKNVKLHQLASIGSLSASEKGRL